MRNAAPTECTDIFKHNYRLSESRLRRLKRLTTDKAVELASARTERKQTPPSVKTNNGQSGRAGFSSNFFVDKTPVMMYNKIVYLYKNNSHRDLEEKSCVE